jgi:hypothetical protein
MTEKKFVLTTLSENPEYFEEVITLIEEEFHYSEDHCFELDFAPLMDPLNFENCFLYIDNETNKVAAHLAVCVRTLLKGPIETKIAMIGGIVTSKNHRHKNLFKDLMNHALDTFKDDVSLFILWSDLEGLYERFSFFRTGGIIETGKKSLSSSERPAGYEKTKFKNLTAKDFEKIISLYHSFNEQYFFTIKREEKDWSIIKNMNSIDLYIKRNNFEEIIKYFCINKGRDLTNIVHEISALGPLEYSRIIKDLEGYKVWLPETELDKTSSREIFYTAFMKLGNQKLLNEFLKRLSNNKLSLVKIKDDLVTFSYQDKSCQSSCREFLQFLFGPNPLEEFAPFQLSLYIAGADSI